MHQHIDSKNVDEIAKVLIEVYKLCNIQLDNTFGIDLRLGTLNRKSQKFIFSVGIETPFCFYVLMMSKVI